MYKRQHLCRVVKGNTSHYSIYLIVGKIIVNHRTQPKLRVKEQKVSCYDDKERRNHNQYSSLLSGTVTAICNHLHSTEQLVVSGSFTYKGVKLKALYTYARQWNTPSESGCVLILVMYSNSLPDTKVENIIL